MKANAPERIYIQPDAHDGWFESNPHSNIFVEYIRKDAFIEKAVEWIETNVEYYVKGDKMCNVPMCPQFNVRDFLRHFKIAMKL